MTTDLDLKINEAVFSKESSSNKFINVAQLIRVFVSCDFHFVQQRVYEFPDYKIYGSIRKKMISYIDDNMQIKRTYQVVSFKKDSSLYYYLDVEKDKNKLAKEVLFFINVDEQLIHQVVYHQVVFGNHKWLSKEALGLLRNKDFVMTKHCKTLKNTVFSIVRKLKIGI